MQEVGGRQQTAVQDGITGDEMNAALRMTDEILAFLDERIRGLGEHLDFAGNMRRQAQEALDGEQEDGLSERPSFPGLIAFLKYGLFLVAKAFGMATFGVPYELLPTITFSDFYEKEKRKSGKKEVIAQIQRGMDNVIGMHAYQERLRQFVYDLRRKLRNDATQCEQLYRVARNILDTTVPSEKEDYILLHRLMSGMGLVYELENCHTDGLKLRRKLETFVGKCHYE